MKNSIDVKGRYSDNIFVEQLWRTVKYKEVYLRAYARVLEVQEGWKTTSGSTTISDPISPWATGPQPKLSHGKQGTVDGESNGRRCSLGEGTEALAGASGCSLNSALILSIHPGSTSPLSNIRNR